MNASVKFCTLALLLLALALSGCPKQAEETTADSAGQAASEAATEMPAEKPAEQPGGTSEPAVSAAAAPDFTLTDLNGQSHNLRQHLDAGNTVVLEWFNPGCSVVHHYYQESTAMIDTYNQLLAMPDSKVVWLAINSQDPTKGGGSLEDNRKAAADWKMPYPVLLDPSGATGQAYGMRATPCIAVITPDGQIRYKGSLDEFARGGGEPPVGTNFVIQAINELAAGKPVSVPETKAMG